MVFCVKCSSLSELTSFLLLLAKDFISCLMEKDPAKRFTCEQALRHPWWEAAPNQRRYKDSLKKDRHRLKMRSVEREFFVCFCGMIFFSLVGSLGIRLCARTSTSPLAGRSERILPRASGGWDMWRAVCFLLLDNFITCKYAFMFVEKGII